jgi:hypothetical protein
VKLLAQRGQARTLARSKETIVADLDEAFGQDMLQEAMQEGVDGERAALRLVGLRVLKAEGHPVVLEFHQPSVTQRDAEDIRGEIL